MATATLERNGTSVSIPLVADSSGQPLVARDIGKPNLDIQNTGALDPRHLDAWSGLESYTILGRFYDSNAYSDAIKLADLIKSNSNGNPLTLSISMPEFPDNMTVAPAAGQDEALNLAYPPGKRNQVDIDLRLTRVNETRGGSDQPASTPTASGSGPIQITDGYTTVDLTSDVEVSRGVGRPQSVIRKNSSNKYPNHEDKHKSAYEGIELSLEFLSNTTQAVSELTTLFGSQLKRNSLTLDFNGLYGLGSFDVVPQGSGALRHTRVSGEQGTALVPTVQLRRVLA